MISIIFLIFANGMKKSTIYKLDQIRLYIGVVGLTYISLDLLFCYLSSLLFPYSETAKYVASAFALTLAVMLIVRHVRCRPLTQEEKEEGLWFQIHLSR